jgi:hypothetical protein
VLRQAFSYYNSPIVKESNHHTYKQNILQKNLFRQMVTESAEIFPNPVDERQAEWKYPSRLPDDPYFY